eukprot:CAMPEP_0194763212 /NCGR_PEP_ID=MMETSP0323_2-20130528/18518_1 /TAXON_ID=2866 ORGANISM="Crypthecodinium cohnii, Strain Seligo" /NCGR_SAMPLE_ID=MMETSP0323_2 /ASSEMBLY_ACC=CAM_ASM_000346 /LENGTH=42 /DNA_ID= /DNA_START= /DNA_END= /DNA_ORIENTATION=
MNKKRCDGSIRTNLSLLREEFPHQHGVPANPLQAMEAVTLFV